MSNIPVQKAVEQDALPAPWINELEAFSERVRKRAFELFEKYGRPAGQQLEHWFEAEKQLFSTPRSELLDTAACDYVKRVWRWQPPTNQGAPVAVSTRVSVKWDLKDAK